MNFVYILLLNWNGWQDTIECLESVFRNDYSDYRVVVCDNDSQDGSLERIKKWAEGELQVEVAAENRLRHFSFPAVSKPIQYVEYSRTVAEDGGVQGDDPPLVLISTGGNLGFAGGNNVGLRYILARNNFAYVWLLNNDTVIEPDALTWMVKRMTERPDAGICGSLIPYYDEPETLWAQGGGIYNNFLAKPVQGIGLLKRLGEAEDVEAVERKMDYVAGASMLVSQQFLLDVGLLCEDYFLYFEEPDWAMRAKNRFALTYAHNSIVYHKVGMSVKNYDNFTQYINSKYLYSRNELMFAARFFPFAVPIVIIRVTFRLFLQVIGKVSKKIKILLRSEN